MLREAGAEVLGIASIFTYGMQKGCGAPGRGQRKKYQPVRTSIPSSEVAAEERYIAEADKTRLIAFRD